MTKEQIAALDTAMQTGTINRKEAAEAITRHEAARKAESAHHITKEYEHIRQNLGLGIAEGTEKSMKKLLEDFQRQPLQPSNPAPYPTQPFPFQPWKNPFGADWTFRPGQIIY